MRFIWDAANTAHIARHRLTPEQVEAVWEAADFGCATSRGARLIAEGTTVLGLVRVAYYADDGEVYVVTAHRITRRKT